MKFDLRKQYNNFNSVYSDNIAYDDVSTELFYKELLTLPLKDKTILDIGCGDGTDIRKFEALGAIATGIEPSEEFVKSARKRNPATEIVIGTGEHLPFKDGSFDIVISKWALQTSFDVSAILAEAARVVKPGGYLIYLTKHPLQQYFGKMREYGNEINYYDQMVSTLHIYGGKITLKEPTHTLKEYFNPDFLKSFEVLSFTESSDFPASERFHNGTYPTFFIVKARRK